MISAHQVQFERHFVPVFEPLSFSVGAGDLLLVTGPNGSGKTTVIRLLAGLLAPTSGAIRCDANGRGYVGHQLAVKEDLSVAENLAFAHRFSRGGGHPETALRAFGLEAAQAQLARSLSAGQRKRCALARLLLSDAPLWLLDEPYSNLDSDGVAAVDRQLRAHLDRQGACVMSTHGGQRPAGLVSEELHLERGPIR